MSIFDEYRYGARAVANKFAALFEKEKKMTDNYDKKVWSVTSGRYEYDDKEVMTRAEADALAAKRAAGNYNQVQIWELVGTVQNKMPVDLVITPIT
jgi:hypothetical protein